MTEQHKKPAKRNAYLDKIRPVLTERFQHFETEQQKKEHLEYIERNLKELPF
jgi:hypothetical protein